MSDYGLGTTLEVHLPETPLSKFEREKRAFWRLLPALLTTHSGQYVAIHEEQVVDSGSDQVDVALRVQRRVGAVPIDVHLVSENPRQICRISKACSPSIKS